MCGGAVIEIAAGEDWDDFVATAVTEEWREIEALSGIPGRVGATPIQNVGAYGQEVAEPRCRCVRTWDRGRHVPDLLGRRCGFGYRSSRFKAEPARYVRARASPSSSASDRSMPVKYAELARCSASTPSDGPR